MAGNPFAALAGAMLRIAFGIGLGFALAALVLRPDRTRDVRGDRASEPVSASAGAIVVELEDQIGVPPSDVTEIPPKDSFPARRQAVARTLRDLLRNPPEVEQRPLNPDAAMQFNSELAAALTQGDRP